MGLPSKTRELYSDVVAAGGLIAALDSAFQQIASPLRSKVVSLSNIPFCTCVTKDERFSQIYTAAEERLFLFDFWRDGVQFANGRSPDINEMATAIDRWVEKCCSVADLGNVECVKLAKEAVVFDAGNEVEHRWQSYLHSVPKHLSALIPFIALAAQQPVLRNLYPYTSHYTFCLSRCTGYPFSYDCPHVTPNGKGQFRIATADNEMLGIGNAEYAVSLVLGNLPKNCGPAICGDADKLNVS